MGLLFLRIHGQCSRKVFCWRAPLNTKWNNGNGDLTQISWGELNSFLCKILPVISLEGTVEVKGFEAPKSSRTDVLHLRCLHTEVGWNNREGMSVIGKSDVPYVYFMGEKIKINNWMKRLTTVSPRNNNKQIVLASSARNEREGRNLNFCHATNAITWKLRSNKILCLRNLWRFNIFDYNWMK